MNLQHIRYEQKESIAYITLHRPDKMNAFTEIMLREWCHILHQIEQDISIRVVITSGTGRAWSAGVDLSVFETVEVKPGYQMWQDGNDIIETLERMPQVNICMLNGYCFTGAMEIMLAFDLIVAADEAKIGDTHCKWGIPPKWGMTQRLQHQVGLRKAKELSFTAKAITGQEAAQIGLVNKSVPLDQLAQSVDQMAQEIIANSQQTIAAVKNLYNFGSKYSLAEGLAYEMDYETNLTDKADDLKNFKNKL